MHSKKQWAQYHDNRLLELAMYQLSEGLTLPVKDRDKLYEKFAEFKGLVKRGSFTIEQLEESVYGRYGIIPDPDTDRSDAHNFISALEKLAGLTGLPKEDEESEESS